MCLKLLQCAIAFLLLSCSYQFQGSKNPLKELGIEKIYVKEFRNDTFRPGIEQLFSTAMIREIKKSRSFTIVNSEEAADAVLIGTITSAEVAPNSTKSVALSSSKNMDVSSEYVAAVNCSIILRDRTNRVVFSQSVPGSKIFPGSVRTGDAGATTSLVNDSEQRLAIQFLASQMMASAYQRMIDTF